MGDVRDSGPWTLSWVHWVLALAVGAGVPLVWMGMAPPAHVVSVAAIGSTKPAPAPAVQELMALPLTEPAQPQAAASPTSAAAPEMRIARLRDPDGDQSPDITDFINQGEVPTMSEVISRLHAAGVSGGLGAFNPPGTRPPLIGIAVSEGFELPPGYVRHHQFTDDGRRIEPILMFAPDHPFVVAAGQASAMAQDRVVPPALVPPGLPIRQIVLPPAAEPGK